MLTSGRPHLWLGGVLILFLAVTGCQTPVGTPWQQETLPEGAPSPASILADLAHSEAALQCFRGTGSFVVETPELASAQALHQSSVYFRRPADLHVIGRKYSKTVVRLTCVGDEFLFEFPTEKEYYYRLDGEFFASAEMLVSPIDIVREMFLPEAWSVMRPARLRVTAYQPDAQTAEVAVLGEDEKTILRRLSVAGPPWVIVKNERLGEQGATVAVTTSSEYREVGGLFLPMKIDAVFPSESTRMMLDFRKLVPNDPIDDALFDIDASAAEIGIDLDRASGQPQQGQY